MVGTPEAPEWIARDVCAVLGLDQAHGARVPAEEKGLQTVETPGGAQKMATVTEAGLYRLIFTSRRPEAERFKSWVVGEVLPSIRRHGCYPPPAAIQPTTREQRIALALVEANDIISEQAARLAVAEPKAAVLDAIHGADGDMGLQDAARRMGLQPNKAIWTWEEDGLLFRGSHGTLTPRVEYSCAPEGNGVFRFVTTEAVDGRTYGQTKVTPRGLVWLAERYAVTSTSVVLQ